MTSSLPSGAHRDLRLSAASPAASAAAALTAIVASYGFVVVRSVLYVFALGSRHGRRGCVMTTSAHAVMRSCRVHQAASCAWQGRSAQADARCRAQRRCLALRTLHPHAVLVALGCSRGADWTSWRHASAHLGRRHMTHSQTLLTHKRGEARPAGACTYSTGRRGLASRPPVPPRSHATRPLVKLRRARDAARDTHIHTYTDTTGQSGHRVSRR